MTFLTLFQAILVLAISPFVSGLIRKIKARLQCRRGPALIQPYYNLVKLFRKEIVSSHDSSWIFIATPYILFSSTLTASLLVPIFLSQVPFNFAGDIITVVYLLALGTFFLMLAGLDSGSPFGGMGSSREAIVAALTEPAMILSIFAVGLTAGSTNLSTIVHKMTLSGGIMSDPPPHLLALAALFIVTLAETGRVPVDNPATHLELTMIHEGMILEYSGRYLALIEWASAIKLLLFLTLISNIFAPWGIATEINLSGVFVGIGVWLAKVSFLGVLISVIESMFAKLRLFRITELLGVAFILSLLSLVFYYILRA
ncbi:MAG: respiratory chain complex I subunit 1 family protein [Nitrospirae bacterium]|nr:respiratory chain complex I subunit 1 family protein [Nitrospirota bacterium]MBI3594499.1 respiratory chain complex I subunit 1 family protein [Nitrospirota bacterium]